MCCLLMSIALLKQSEHRKNAYLSVTEACMQSRSRLLKSSEGEHLIYEEHARYDGGFAFFSPLSHFAVYLLPDLMPDLACVTGKEG